jgi:glyceraldehyde 3-phosphate dehydrogenase
MAPHNDATWTDRQAVAEQLIPLIGALYRDNGVVTSIHGRRLINSSPLQIVKAHRYARHVDGQELDINRTLELIKAIVELNPGPASINVAGILSEQANSGKSIAEFAAAELAPVAGKGKPASAEDAKDVSAELVACLRAFSSEMQKTVAALFSRRSLCARVMIKTSLSVRAS